MPEYAEASSDPRPPGSVPIAPALLEDAALLALVQQGSELAVVTLFDRHAQSVYHVALRVLRDPASAEDIVQEIFLQVWLDPDRFQVNRGSLGAWLSVLSRHRSIDLLRKRKPCDSIEDLVLKSPSNVAAACEHRLLLDRARELMQQLSAEQRQALDLAFFHGLTHQEIAAATGLPLGTVKARIRKALQILREAAQP